MFNENNNNINNKSRKENYYQCHKMSHRMDSSIRKSVYNKKRKKEITINSDLYAVWCK